MNVTVKLFDKTISKNEDECFLILEAGTNHYELADYRGISPFEAAVETIKEAKEGKGDAIKFQAYNADKTSSKKYASNQYNYMRRRDSLNVGDYKKLIKYGKKIGIPVFFSFFDLDTLQALGGEVGAFKVASPDITNFPLLEAINTYKKTVIISTAGAVDYEINNALTILKDCDVAIMHCRAIYPTPMNQLDLGIIRTLNESFPNNVIGYSNHSHEYKHFKVGEVAYVLGARVLEFHFKVMYLNLKGGDYPVSITKQQSCELKQELKTISSMYGNDKIRAIPEEEPLRQKGRRGLYAARNISTGARIDADDFIALRPSVIKGFDIVQANESYNFSSMVLKETMMVGEPLIRENLEILND